MERFYDFDEESVPEYFPRDLSIEDEDTRESQAEYHWHMVRSSKNPRKALADYIEMIHERHVDHQRAREQEYEDPAIRNAEIARKRRKTIQAKLDSCDLATFFDTHGLTRLQAIRKCRAYIRLYGK